MKKTALALAVLILGTLSCTSNYSSEKPFSGENPWPEIRKERMATLLPTAMERAGVEAWAVICRSNNNDPLARHIGCENAVSPAVFVFHKNENEVVSIVFSPAGEATALREIGLHDSVVVVTYGMGAYAQAAAWINTNVSGKLALNYSENITVADGLSHTQFRQFTRHLSAPLRSNVVSSEELVYEWLSVKTPAEVEIMREAAALTARWEKEAYARIIPNKTTDREVASWLQQKIADAGLGHAWAADQNPLVNSGPDRGHAHATDRIIRPGDVIQTDFGIRVYDMWVTDIQRFAYVLHKGETAPPAEIQRYWEIAREGNRRAFAAMRPGATGYDVDRAQRDWMNEQNSLPVMWSTGHPVGYEAHDVGPSLGGAQESRDVRPSDLRELRPGQVFAFDGFFRWEIEGGYKTISVEEMAVITEHGAEFLIPPQEELILIPSR